MTPTCAACEIGLAVANTVAIITAFILGGLTTLGAIIFAIIASEAGTDGRL